MARRVLRCFLRTRRFKLVVWKANTEGFGDADDFNNIPTRRSVSGYVVQVHGTTVVHKSKQQKRMAKDIYAADFLAAIVSAEEVKWLHNICEELNLQREQTTLHNGTIAVIRECDKNYSAKSGDI